MEQSLAVVVLAAGKSTRFKSDTTKLLHELCGKPMIEWVLDAALPLEPGQIVIVYGEHSAELTERYADGYEGRKLAFVPQDPPLGTGHALSQAEPALGPDVSQVLVLPGDAPALQTQHLAGLLAACRDHQASHAVLTVTAPDPRGYGRVVRDKARPELVRGITEDIEADSALRKIDEVNSGIYVFTRDVFDQLRQAAEELGPSRGKGEYYLTDIVRFAQVLAVKDESFPPPVGVNDRVQFCAAEQVLLRRLREHWMEEGVTFRLPETTYLHHDVRLAQDVEIGPHCVLLRGSRIGRGSILVQGCLLETCIVGEDCNLRHVRGWMSVLEDRVTAGPYVNLRPGSILHEGVKVGNFVETKNADVGAGSKLPHLQYIGDATLGEDCNIGAGTIFCNYDGFTKLHTVLGDGVFIGSNSSLQGGITLGDEAYVAMGSAITRSVPAGALAIARAHQVNKEDYVKVLKERLKRRNEQNQQASGGAK